MSKQKILFIQRQFSHYRKAVFDRISRDYIITVLHTGIEETIKEEIADYAIKVKYLKYGKKTTNLIIFGFKEILNKNPDIVIHEANPSILSIIFVFLFKFILGYKFVLWGHGYNRTKGFNLDSYKNRIRLLLMKISDAVIFYDYATKNLFCNYLEQEKLFVALNTIDTQSMLMQKKMLELQGRDNLKKKTKFDAQFNLLFLGRLLKDKKPIEAIMTFLEIKAKLKDTSIKLHIVGKGPEESNIVSLLKMKKIENDIIMHGEVYEERELAKILFLSDIVINPGYVGLNVNHAFCFNIPVFTFSQGKLGPFHSPEIEYIKHDETGFLAKPFDYDQLAELILTYIRNNTLQERIKQNIQSYTNNVITIENMIKGLKDCFNYLNSN